MTCCRQQVSRLQVAKLVAAAVADPSASAGKVLEVVAETDAPLRPYAELLSDFVAGKSDADWKRELPAQAYYVLRQEGTERPW
jgi:hypothetical protein